MTQDRVMLLIDADNVSVDIMEQAIERLLADYGALHVRRAYCTAESAVKHQGVFKRLGIKPMVNLAAGKNSTDIALAVDALDLVLAERPDVVVIASSDSDFAPLVGRLREKGCRVRGIGQEGKTGDETLGVYDEFTVLAHRKAGADGGEAPTGSRRRAPARKAATKKAAPARKAVADKPPAAKEPAVVQEVPAAAPADKPTAKKTPARKAAAKKTAAKKTPAAAKTTTRRSGRRQAEAVDLVEAVLEVLPPLASEPAPAPARAPARTPPPQVAELLRALPALAQGERVEVQRAAEELRKANLLSKRSSVPRLLGRFPEWFELHPHSSPKWVRARTPDDESTQGR